MPCDVGAEVFEIYQFCESGALEIDCHKVALEDLDKIGKTIFLTKKDALKKIREITKGEMNIIGIDLVECKIKEIHSVTDVSDKFEADRGYEPREMMLEIDMSYEKLGEIERNKFWYYKSEWESLKVDGCFWGEL